MSYKSVADLHNIEHQEAATAKRVMNVDESGNFVSPVAGVQYTEGDTDATITGTAIMWEDAADTLRAVSAAKPLPVDVQNSTLAVTQSGTWNINNISGTISLPTGAAIAANQLPDGHNVTIDNAGGASAVNIQDGGNSITVDGTVAATQSGTWNLNDISGTVSLPTGASTLAEQQTQTTHLSTIAGAVSGTEIQVDVVASLPAGTNNIGDVDIASGPTGASALEVQGTVAAGSAIANNPVPIGLRDVTGQVEYAAGADLGGGITVQYVFPVDGGLTAVNYAADGSTPAVGNVAHDAVDTEGPVKIGGKATDTAMPTAVAKDDRVNAAFDDVGRLHVDHNKAHTATTATATASGNTTIITPSSGKALRVKSFHMVNNDASTGIDAGLRFAAAGTIKFGGTLPLAGGTRLMNLIHCNWEGAADEALIINLGAAGDVDVTVQTEEF